eukprot:1559214-Karenia_brevis.AAC.1
MKPNLKLSKSDLPPRRKRLKMFNVNKLVLLLALTAFANKLSLTPLLTIEQSTRHGIGGLMELSFGPGPHTILPSHSSKML